MSVIAGNFELGDAEVLLPFPARCSAGTFVLRVRGESMEPKFHDDGLIFVDPQVAPVSGRYVVVRLEDSQEATLQAANRRRRASVARERISPSKVSSDSYDIVAI